MPKLPKSLDTTQIKLPPPRKRGPKPLCDCGICPTCLNRNRVFRQYYAKKFGKDSTIYKEMVDGQLC